MNGFRACGVLVALAAIAFVLVTLRAEQTRVAARTLSLETEWIQLRRELWALQTGVARLRAPHAIRDRVGEVDRFETELVGPVGSVYQTFKHPRSEPQAPARGL